MKKHRLHDIVLGMVIMALVMGLAVPAFAANDEADQAAQALYELGLFSGTGLNADGTPNFDLNRSPTRQEAITMLVRLLGKEKEAQAGTWETPFTDVDGWAKPYVGYAYTNHLTGGTSPTTFSGNDTITVSQYITFILRALGYADGADFQWDKAWELSDKIGLTSGEYNSSTVSFLRGDVANISCTALTVCLKDSDKKLSDKLIDEGIFTREAYRKLEEYVTAKRPKTQSGDKDWVGTRPLDDLTGGWHDTYSVKDNPAVAAIIKETNAEINKSNGDLGIRPADAPTTNSIWLEIHDHDDYSNEKDGKLEYWLVGLGSYVGSRKAIGWDEKKNNPIYAETADYLKVVKVLLSEIVSDPEDVEAIYDMVEDVDKNGTSITEIRTFNTVIVDWRDTPNGGVSELKIWNK